MTEAELLKKRIFSFLTEPEHFDTLSVSGAMERFQDAWEAWKDGDAAEAFSRLGDALESWFHQRSEVEVGEFIHPSDLESFNGYVEYCRCREDDFRGR